MAKVLTSLFVPVGGGAVLITAVLMLEWWASLFILRKFNVGYGSFVCSVSGCYGVGTYCSPYYHLNSILSLVIVLYIFLWLYTDQGKMALLGDGVYFVVCGLLYGGEPVVYFCNPCAVVRGGNRREALGVLGFAVDNGTVLPEFLKELYSLSEEQAYQYPQAWLPAFFPAIMLACVLVATQFKKVRYMQISVWSVSVTSGLLLVLLALTAFNHAVG